MHSIKLFILIFCLLSLSNCVMANDKGIGDPVLTGSVFDSLSKKPVKGVTISVISSKDRIGKLVTTDASGKFVFPKLPAGEITIVLEKKGYKTFRREKIILKEGMQVKLNVDLINDSEPEDKDNNFFHPLLRMMDI